MEIVGVIIECFILFILLCFGFIIKNYYPKYFEEKGRNLATKQDIGEITNIVESIKYSLTLETEVLKSRLASNNQNNFSIKSAERDALFDFNKKCSSWIYSIMRFSLSSYSQDNYQELDKVAKNFSDKQFDLDIAHSHLVLFMQDQEMLDIIKELNIEIIGLESIVISNAIKLKHKYQSHQIKYNTASTTEKLSLNNELYKSIEEINKEFSDSRILGFKKVHYKKIPLVKLIKSRIDSIIQELETDVKL